MKRLNYIFVLIVILSTLMIGCSSRTSKEPPITIGANNIDYIIGKNNFQHIKLLI